MANYTFSNIAIEGPKPILEKIAKAISESNGYAKDAIEKIGLPSDICDFDERTEWTNAEVKEIDGKSVLFFEQAYPWIPEFIILYVLDELCEGEYAFYHQSNEWEDIEHVTNDVEGKYFPERYIVCCDIDDEDVYVETEDDVIANIKERIGAPESLNTVEELTSWAEEQDIHVDVFQIFVSASLGPIVNFTFDFSEFEGNEG